MQLLLMGNKVCCRVEKEEFDSLQEEKIKSIQFSTSPPQPCDPPSTASQQKPPEDHNSSSPSLSAQVQAVLQTHSQLVQLAQQAKEVRKFGKEVYVGQLDQQTKTPQGYGKIYKTDGSIYLGSWSRGKAEGKGLFIQNDGSFYEGQFFNNHAHGKGRLVSNDLLYQGEFQLNKFEGYGIEKGNNYSFEGLYKQGNKLKGLLIWKQGEQRHAYNGQFNPTNEFQGQGILKEPSGVYEGQFNKGQKHGNGEYKFENGLSYKGEYREGRKCGKGTIFNCNGSIAYQGNFQDDMPHGAGYIYDQAGNMERRKWVKGIDVEAL